jgi:hypothetical protein
MADSLALKVAKVERELLRSRSVLAAAVTAGSLAINLKEGDTRADATRIVITATRGAPEMEGALSATGIWNIAVTIAIKIKIGTGSAALVDAWLREIDEAHKAAPGAPSAGYAAALATLSIFTIKDDDNTEQEDEDNIRKLDRTFNVLAREA